MNKMLARNTTNTKLRNLIQPILVKKSYLYLGIPPRIKTSNAISIINLSDILSALSGTYLRRTLGDIKRTKSSKF